MAKNVCYTPCYKADMRDLFQILLNREKNVVEVHKLLGLMFNVIWYLRKLNESTDIDCTKQILDDVENAKNDLREIIKAWCLSDSDKELIWSLTLRTV